MFQNKISTLITKARLFNTFHYPCLASVRVDYGRCYRILGLKADCDEEEVRASFITLAKKYHPDSGSETSSAEKFQEVEAAYRQLQEKIANERHNESENEGEYGLYHKDNPAANETNEEDASDEKYTAPQHRQFLSYGGFGHGNLFQREKQYQKHRAMKAVENVYSHRVEKLHAQEDEHALLVKEVKAAKKIKTQFGMDRLVEDLIQESMAKGEFQNLKGSGKPLKNQAHNPYIDIVTHKINQVLIDNGFSPRWVMLEKEIRQEISELQESLAEERSFLGKQPLDPIDQQTWSSVLERHREKAVDLNKKISNYNLVVPSLHKQMVHVNLHKLGDKILNTEPSKHEIPPEKRNRNQQKLENFSSSQNTSSLFDLFSGMWR